MHWNRQSKCFWKNRSNKITEQVDPPDGFQPPVIYTLARGQMNTCDKCSAYGLRFSRAHRPEQFFEGKASSRIWIIGINPKNTIDYNDTRTDEQLRGYFDQRWNVHGYFHDFDKVSAILYELLGVEGGAGHTDLVKCYSPTWPPENGKSVPAQRAIVTNCQGFLREQLSRGLPDLVICNGSPVCDNIRDIIPVVEDHDTYYYGKLNGKKIAVVLAGFIGRIDDYAKRRLGKEVEKLMKEFGIQKG